MRRLSPSLSAGRGLHAGRLFGYGAGPPPDTLQQRPRERAVVDAWTADPHYCMIRSPDTSPGPGSWRSRPTATCSSSPAAQIVVLLDDERGRRVRCRRAHDVRAAPGRQHGLAITATHVYASSSDDRLSLALRVRRSHRDRRDGDRRTGIERRPLDTHAGRRRAEPALRQHRQRQQRRHARPERHRRRRRAR